MIEKTFCLFKTKDFLKHKKIKYPLNAQKKIYKFISLKNLVTTLFLQQIQKIQANKVFDFFFAIL